MAFLAKHFSLILFISLTLSFHVHARDSQFFSKVTNTINENTQEVQVETPNREEPLKTQENGSNFVQDSQNGYGLWGPESGQNPPSAAKTTTSAATTTTTTNNNEAFVSDPQGMSNTRFAEKRYTTTNNNNNNSGYVADSENLGKEHEYQNNYNNEVYMNIPQGMRSGQKEYTTAKNNNYYNNGAYVVDPQGSSDNYNTEAYVTNPQAMSDTRISNQWYTHEKSSSNNNNNFYNSDAYMADPEGSSASDTPNKYQTNYNNEAYVTNQQGMHNTRFAQKGYTTSSNNNNNNNYNSYYDNGAYVADPMDSSGKSFEEKEYTAINGNQQGMSNGNNYYNGANNYNTQKQGMSDTRFMENGKYYYDLKGENNYQNGYNYNSNNGNYVNRGMNGTSLMGNSYNTQKQGMSDNRFLENGKYYYDLKSENNYGHGYGNMKGVSYNNQGYNGNQEFEENQEEEYLP